MTAAAAAVLAWVAAPWQATETMPLVLLTGECEWMRVLAGVEVDARLGTHKAVDRL